MFSLRNIPSLCLLKLNPSRLLSQERINLPSLALTLASLLPLRSKRRRPIQRNDISARLAVISVNYRSTCLNRVSIALAIPFRR